LSEDRRRSRRRTLPFLRSAVLEWGEEAHIVILADISIEGAFLTTHLPIAPPPEGLRLRIVAPRHSREVVVPCALVWSSGRFEAASGRPAGVAVRFEALDPEMHSWIEEFSLEGFRPSVVPTPAEHYEHRIIERASVDVLELNRFGRDGWQVVTMAPSANGFKVVLVRRI
jgi:hypothetical protein